MTAVSDKPLVDIVGADPHPYSYYWLERKLPNWFFTTDLAFRLPSAVFSCFSLILFSAVLRRAKFDSNLIRWFVLVFALLPLNVRYAQEARAYSLCQFLGMLVLLSYLACLEKADWKRLVALWVCVVASMHVDGFGWLTPFAIGVHSLFRLSVKGSWRILSGIVLGGVAALPYTLFRLRLMSEAGEVHAVGTGRLLKAFAARWLELSPVGIAFDVASSRHHWIIWNVSGLAAIVFIVGAASLSKLKLERGEILWSLLLFAPFAVLLVGSIATDQILIFKKYLIPVAPAVAILFTLGIFRLTRGSLVVAMILLLVVPLCVSVASNIREGDRADWRSLYTQMRDFVGADDHFIQERHMNYPLYSFGPLRAYAWREGRRFADSHFVEYPAEIEIDESNDDDHQLARGNAGNSLVAIMNAVHEKQGGNVWTLTSDWMADGRMIDLATVAVRDREFRAKGVRGVRWIPR